MTRLDLLQMQVEEQRIAHGLPDGWRFFRVESLSHGKTLYMLFTGAVAPLCEKGNRKGKPDWKKRDKKTERQLIISLEDSKRWMAAWEQRTGLCSDCTGTGEVFLSWNIDTGTKMAQCHKCSGTGKLAESAVS